MKNYHVGIYARLSRDDERQGESVSIENQKRMLRRYCHDQGWEVTETYVDDGWSGTNFARPGFQRMMEAVREKRVDLVLVKDLSRLGRDYIEVGKYTDCVFPYYGCRFIALNDGVDTLRQNDDVAMIFKNVINDIYARDTSKKIRAVRRSNAECGKFMGCKPPYGYLRDPADKHHLIVDEEAAKTVRKIFALRKNGCGMQAIADTLNQEALPPPRDYAAGTTEHTWCRETVRAILRNETYTGTMVQLKQGSISYKDRRQRQKPPDTWVRVPFTHEPIVDGETWAAVRALDSRAHSPRRCEREDPFQGLLYCAQCGKALQRVVNYRKRNYTYYICRGHTCLSGAALEEVLSRDIREHLLALEPEILLKEGGLDRERKAREGDLYKKKLSAERRLRKLEDLQCRLYEDHGKGVVPSSVFQSLMARYEKEREEKERELLRLGSELENSGVEVSEAWLRQRLETPAIWRPLVKRIEVGPGGRSQTLHIHYHMNALSCFGGTAPLCPSGKTIHTENPAP